MPRRMCLVTNQNTAQSFGISHLNTGKAGGLKLRTAQSGDSKDYLTTYRWSLIIEKLELIQPRVFLLLFLYVVTQALFISPDR